MKKPKNTRLADLSIGDTITWQERPAKVTGKKRHNGELLVALRLLPVHLAEEERENALEQQRSPRDMSFWTRPVATGLVVRRG